MLTLAFSKQEITLIILVYLYLEKGKQTRDDPHWLCLQGYDTMIKQMPAFLISLLIATFLLVTQTTMTNLFWLKSINMPVDLYVVLSSMATDLVGMNSKGAFPVIGLIFVGLLVAFVTARIISIRISINKPILYAMAGGAALLAIVVLMPLAFYNLDLIAGARTLAGKVYLICAGMLAGYYFGSHPAKGVSNEI